MNPKKRKISLLRIGITAGLTLAVLQIILLGASYLRASATRQLEKDRLALEENYAELEKVNQAQLDNLHNELAQVQAEVADLEGSFPELGAPFALYRKGLDLAESSRVDLRSITRNSTEIQETAAGSILVDEYSIELAGTLGNCINFIAQLEGAGLDTIVLQSASFWPEEQHCSLDLITRGLPPAVEE